MAELFVATDLMRRGYSVFRCVSPNSPCDLAILMGERLLRIEVRTGQIGVNGKWHYPKNATDCADHYAVVDSMVSGVTYFPPI